MAGGFILLMSMAVLYDWMMMMMMIIVGIVSAAHHIRYTDLLYGVLNFEPLNFATIHFWSLLK